MNAIPIPAEPNLTAVRSSGGVYRSLEYWRGLAALWVMTFHVIGSQENPVHPLTDLLRFPARPGWLGVHLWRGSSDGGGGSKCVRSQRRFESEG